jgi:DNA mismatch repair protein MutL
MQKIKRLSEQTINQIAAGEVIENPASAVKELVENAIDAGATCIRVETLGGGQKLIRIADDGCGMEKEDALLSLERHATSKIADSDDLFHLVTMGFRGEALASIAAVSCLSLSTATEEGIGYQVEVEGGKKIKNGPCARKKGTTVEVRSLFFNVPARKKFQKSPQSNTAEITRQIISLSLAHPMVAFELFHQEKPAFSQLSISGGSFEEALGQRILSLFGKSDFEKMYPIVWEEESFCLKGWVGSPQQSRQNRSGQYLFVNSRPVACPLISFAVKDAFGTRVATTKHPFFVLHLDLHPSMIDVNVHPQKREIRFREEDFIKKKMREAVEKALQRVQNVAFPVSFKPHFSNSDFLFQEKKEVPHFSSTLKETRECVIENNASLPIELPSARPIGLFSSYLLIEAESVKSRMQFLAEKEKIDGMLFVDLKTAYARVIFERLLNEQRSQESQRLLIPHPFSLSPVEANELSGQEKACLQMGIILKQVSPTVFLIEGIPPFSEIEDVVSSLTDFLSDVERQAPFNEKKKKQLAISLSSFAKARKKNFMLQEALGVFEELLKTSSPTLCPLGQQTVIYVSQDEIGRFFSKKCV